MSFQLSRRDVDAAYSYANRSMRRLRDPEKDEKSVLNKLLQTGEVLAGAAVVGVASGRFGPLNVAGTPIPLDLVGGVGGHLIAFWLDGTASKHIHNVANGVLAGYVTKLGVGVGAKLRTKAGLSPFTLQDVTGADPMLLAEPQIDIVGRAVGLHKTGAAPLTEAELAALAQQVR
jgi:hypothetical protein